MDKKNLSLFYMVATVVFVSCLLISNVAASKVFAMGPLVISAGTLLFPITYIINDMLSEVYGFKRARLSIFLGFAMNLIMVLYFALTIILPAPGFWHNQSAYVTVLGNTPRLLIASMIGYLVGSTLNSKVLVVMKGNKGDRGLFIRCILSTLFGESADSIIFNTIAFLGTMPLQTMLIMIVTQAVLKTAYEFIIYPVTRKIIIAVKRHEGVR